MSEGEKLQALTLGNIGHDCGGDGAGQAYGREVSAGYGEFDENEGWSAGKAKSNLVDM